MKTITRTNARGTRTWKITRPESAFESWARGDDEALLHYHEGAPGTREDRHLVTLHWLTARPPPPKKFPLPC
jgi:hypothetical protein